MAKSFGRVEKIYDIRIVGFDAVHDRFATLSTDLAKIKKAMIDLQGQKLGATGKELDDVNKKIVQTAAAEKQLEAQGQALNVENKLSISHFAQLNNAYQLAKTNVQELAARYGAESAQAKEAAAQAQVYKTQLLEINALLKGGVTVVQKPLTVAPADINAYKLLNEQYLVAKKNAQDLAAAYGVESAQAKEAAVAAAAYKEQLAAINDLVKSGGGPKTDLNTPLPADIPLTTNLEALAAERDALQQTGAIVNQLDIEMAEASNSATVYGHANRLVAEEVKVSGESIVGIKTKYEEFTGTIRQNIIAQTENTNALTANKAQQKEINASITAAGFATEKQVNKLATLREEELLLIESNKSLSVTVRNQAKEYLAAGGSIDELQAQINQLQQSYETLSDVEKASPFGQKMKAEIDILEPKVKSLEAELGKFQRNVGNYPQLFGGAFKVLENELDVIKGKLVSGNFTGKDLDTLTAREKVLTSATQALGTQFTSTAAKANAYREVGRQLAITFGIDSQVFKEFSASVAASNVQLQIANQQLAGTSTSGDKAIGAFKKIYGGLRSLANLLPGLGISSLLLLIPNLAIAAYNAIFKTSNIAKKVQDDLKEAYKETSKEIGTQVGELQILYKITQDGTQQLDDRVEATNRILKINKENNEATGETTRLLTDQNGVLKGQPELIDKISESLIKQAKTKAVLNLIEKAYGDLVKAQTASYQDQLNFAQKASLKINEIVFGGPSVSDVQKAAQQKGVTDAQTYLKTIQDVLANGLKSGDLDFSGVFGKGDAATKSLTSKLSVFLQEKIKQIDTIRETEKSKENTLVNEIAKIRQLTFDEEIDHLKRLEKINTDALQKKIDLFNRQKKLNKEENLSLAQFGEDKSNIELDTSQKINAIEKKRFDENLSFLEDQLESELKQIELNKQAVINSVTASEFQKANAQIRADENEIAARTKFYNALLALNDAYNKESVQKAKDAIAAISVQRDKDSSKLGEAELKEIQKARERALARIEIDYQQTRRVILENEKLTADQRKKAVERLDKIYYYDKLNAELTTLTNHYNEVAKQYQKDLATYEEYLNAKAAIEKKKSEVDQAGKDLKKENIALPSDQNSQNVLKDKLSSLFGFDEGTIEDQLLGRFIADSFSLAQEAMNNYFDAERQRIQESLQNNLDRIDADKERAQAQAQSQAERDSLEKQAELKKQKAQQQAGEQLKKVKKAEIKIALATELANIAASAASAGPAAPILYALLAALAFARYAINLASINKEKFEFGGKPGEVPLRGGEFGGRSHSKGGTPFTFMGREYEAEVDELAVIRTKNAPRNKRFTITGTQTQIASAVNEIGGGTRFAPGATVVPQKRNIIKFGFGEQLKEQKSTVDKTENKTYSEVIDKVMNENKQLVENRNVSEIVSRVVKRISETITDISKTTETVVRQVTEKIENKIFSVSGTQKTILSSLHPDERIKYFAHGGEVPTKGGEFGGRSHSRGGTPFIFKSRHFEAEAKEVAIINKKSSQDPKVRTFVGTNKQILSKINELQGGVRFAPGAKIKLFESGGFLGSSLEPPTFNSFNSSSNGMSDKKIDELIDVVKKQGEKFDKVADEQSKRVDKIQVRVSERDISEAQDKRAKQTAIGSL